MFPLVFRNRSTVQFEIGSVVFTILHLYENQRTTTIFVAVEDDRSDFRPKSCTHGYPYHIMRTVTVTR